MEKPFLSSTEFLGTLTPDFTFKAKHLLWIIFSCLKCNTEIIFHRSLIALFHFLTAAAFPKALLQTVMETQQWMSFLSGCSRIWTYDFFFP